MKAKFLVALFVSVLFISCKNEKNDTPTVQEKAPEAKVRVVVNAIVKQDDSFQVFYTEDGSFNFKEEQSVRVNLKGAPESQDIVFNFPDEVVFNQLRLDIGENSKQDPITINSVTVHYFDKKFETAGTAIYNYFLPGDNGSFSYETTVITPKTGENGVYDPILYPQVPLKEELEKLVK